MRVCRLLKPETKRLPNSSVEVFKPFNGLGHLVLDDVVVSANASHGHWCAGVPPCHPGDDCDFRTVIPATGSFIPNDR